LRRRSIPVKPRKQPQNRSDKTAPSVGRPPEVISNLIDSLANISFPDPTEAEKLPPPPRITGNTLRHSGSYDSDAGNGSNGEQGAYRNAIKDQLQGIDDAAEPPVVRTAKLPSTYYQLSRKGNRWENALGISAVGNGLSAAQSNTSLASLGSSEDVRNITVAKQRSVVTSSRESLKHEISVKNASKSTPVMAKSPVKSTFDRKRDTSSGSRSDHSSHYSKTAKTPPPPAFHEPILEDVQVISHEHAPVVSKREGKKPAKSSPSPLSHSPIISGPSVPDRRSSLKHQDIITPEGPRSPARSPAPETTNKFDKRRRQELDEPKTLTTLDLLNGEDTEVTKRIKELKAKKEQREREARESPPAKIDINGLPMDSRTGDSGHMAPPQERPSTPLTPTLLPINYSFVVQSLAEDRNPSRPPSRSPSQSGSIKTQEPMPPTTQQPHPNGLVARTTLSRSVVPKSIFGSKHDPSSGPSPNRLRKERKSLDTQPNNDPRLTRDRSSGSLKGSRARWSISDLPNGLERRSSLKGIDGLSNRPGIHQDPVPEERPSMNEDINRAVDSFIHAQRLSQKIRHPQTGRVISFSEVGNPKGNVVFCCVGMGLTRYITAFYDELASTLNLRLITPDRPGVGDSTTDPNGTPLSWAGKLKYFRFELINLTRHLDDVLLICSALSIAKFSLLAHSAGAIYALATALRIPQNIRGKVHLLAPWIPPSQMVQVGLHQDPPPGAVLPKSQRFLRALPAPLLKVANSSFLSATSASLSPNLGSPASRNKKRKSAATNQAQRSSQSPSPAPPTTIPSRQVSPDDTRRESIMLMDQQNMPSESALKLARRRDLQVLAIPQSPNSSNNAALSTSPIATDSPQQSRLAPTLPSPHQRSSSAPIPHSPTPAASFGPAHASASPELRKAYDKALTLAIWAAATTNANPAVDLLVCLERTQTIGFRYVDITRAIVIHHGSKDSRVPVENVRWLGGMMRRCEVRVLDGEGHGLMASASVMGGVLTEMAKEWEDWDKVVSKGRVSS
jgi:pimeloyl-ACP methyl ester carboxylesterase